MLLLAFTVKDCLHVVVSFAGILSLAALLMLLGRAALDKEFPSLGGLLAVQPEPILLSVVVGSSALGYEGKLLASTRVLNNWFLFFIL